MAQAAATRVETASATKEEKARKRKADALEKKEEKVAKRTADAIEKKEAKKAEAKSGRASSSNKPRSKPRTSAESEAEPKATGNLMAMLFKPQQTTLANFADGVAELLDDNADSAAPMVTVALGPVEQSTPGPDPVVDPMVNDVPQNATNQEAVEKQASDEDESDAQSE
jgi:hypothetical protein